MVNLHTKENAALGVSAAFFFAEPAFRDTFSPHE
jgi:hypothetical protein